MNLNASLGLNAFRTNQWTQTFSETYSSIESFKEDYSEFSALKIVPLKSEGFLEHVFLVLMGEYASNNLSNFSVDQFKIRFWTRVNQYAPQYERELEMQKNLIQATEAEIVDSSYVIYNSAINPSTTVEDPSNSLIKELNTQNTTFHKRSKLDAYSYLRELLKEGRNLTRDFVEKFRDLFTVVLTGPELFYETHISNTEEE